MQLYHVLLEQRAAFLTEPTSGVLLGSLAWAYRDLYGEPALSELLAAYRAADQAGAAPPLICSAALPTGWLPRPHFTYLTPAERTQLATQQFKSSGAAALLRLDQALNHLRGQWWLPQAALRPVVEQVDAFHLFGALLKQMDAPSVRLVSGPLPERERWAAGPAQLQSRLRTQSSINRLTGSVHEGLLFDQEELVYRPGQQLDIWVRIAPAFATDAWLERWRAVFRLLAAQGIGARHSTGAGAVQLVQNLEPAAADALPAARQPNGFLSLSAWVPRPADPDALAYQLDTRHGRLGGLYGAGDNVWKYPVTELLPGAVGRLPAGAALRPVYGGLVENVHRTRPEVVNFGYCFPLGVRLVE
ncbi:MAG: hypothetical protein U0350_18810 [Caldilineaceae bacterium]